MNFHFIWFTCLISLQLIQSNFWELTMKIYNFIHYYLSNFSWIQHFKNCYLKDCLMTRVQNLFSFFLLCFDLTHYCFYLKISYFLIEYYLLSLSVLNYSPKSYCWSMNFSKSMSFRWIFFISLIAVCIDFPLSLHVLQCNHLIPPLGYFLLELLSHQMFYLVHFIILI